MTKPRRAYGVPLVQGIIRSIHAIEAAGKTRKFRHDPFDALEAYRWMKTIRALPFALWTLGAITHTGSRLMPSRFHRNGRKQHLLAYTPLRSSYSYLVIVDEQSTGLTPVLVIRIQFERDKMVDVWCLNGSVVDHFTPTGQLVETSNSLAELGDRAYKLRKAGRSLCSLAESTPEVPPAVKFLSAAIRLAFDQRIQPLEAFVEAGHITCQFDWDRDERGWSRRSNQATRWGVRSTAKLNSGGFSIFSRSFGVDSESSRSAMVFDLHVFGRTSWVSFVASEDRVKIQSDQFRPVVSFDITSRDNQRTVVQRLLEALDMFIADLNAINQP